MKNNKRILIISFLLVFSLLAMLSSVNANTVSLDPNTFNKNTIENASDGTTFQLNPNSGEYNLNSTNVNINITKNITIKSSNSNLNAVINLKKQGGLFNVHNTGSLTLINVTIKNGYSGVIANYGNGLTITGCTFINNDAVTNNGGAIYNSGDNVVITNSVFKDNIALKSHTGGGAIYNNGGVNFKIINSIFTGNSAVTGGAIHNTGDGFTIADSTFIGNTATNGGAIFNIGANVNIASSNFTNNNCIQSGVAIYNTGSNVRVNSIFIDNANDDASIIYNIGSINISGSSFIYNTILTITVDYNCDNSPTHNEHDLVITIKATSKNGKTIIGQPIYLYINGNYVATLTTKENGATYSLANLPSLKTYSIRAELRDFNIGTNQYKGSIATKTFISENDNHTSNLKNSTKPKIKLTKTNIKRIKKVVSRPVIKKNKKIYTITFKYKNFGQTTGSKKFTISIGKKYILNGKIKKNKYITFKYIQKTKKIKLIVKKLPYKKIAIIKFKILKKRR